MNAELNIESKQVFRRIGLNVRDARLRKGMNQADFAKLCEMGRNQIRKLEDGLGGFPFSNFLKICEILKCDAYQMMKPREDLKLFLRAKSITLDNKNMVTIFRPHHAGAKDVRRMIILKRNSLELELKDEQIDFFIVKGPININGGSTFKEFPSDGYICTEGSGLVRIVNYETEIAEILMIKR